MQEQIAAVRTRATRYASILCGGLVLATATLASAAALAAPADIARGLGWLQAQVQADGRLLSESRVAATQQARCESAATLLKLTGSTAQVNALLGALGVGGVDVPTETLACSQQLRQQLGEVLLTPELEQRHVDHVAYGAYEGYGVPSTLDSGWALAAQLQNLGASDKDRLLAWLQANQSTDGGFSQGGSADPMTSAVILRGLRESASLNSVAAAIASKAAAHLLARRGAAGIWSDDVASTALIFEAVHPYTASDPSVASAVSSYLLGQQLPDGSWAGDAFVTAVALRALALSAQPALDPSLAGLSVKFVDARNGAALPGVSLIALTSSAVHGLSDGEGRVEQRGLAAGSYQLQASLSGYATLSFTVTLKAGQVLDAGVLQMLVPDGTSVAVIAGEVREQGTSLPLAGVTVSVDAQARSAITAADGRYLISNVTPGNLTVSARKTGYASAASSVSVLASQVYNFSPSLTPTGVPGADGECKVQGTITDALTHLPLAAVMVSISGVVTQTTTTDAAGHFALTGLTSGLVTLSTTKAGYDSVSVSTRLACSADRATVLDFSPRLYLVSQTPPHANQAGLSGTVMDARTNLPIANAALRVSPEVGTAVTTVSAADGSFRVEGLNGASAQVEVSASGYQGATLQFALLPLEVFDLGQIRLRPPKVEQLLPDLKVMVVRRATAHTDPQTLQLSGTVEVEVSNVGTQSAPSGVEVLAFSDVNRNEKFDAYLDLVLGQTALNAELAPGQSTTLSINVSSTLAFRDAPIHVMIDPAAQLPELNKANNLRSSAQEVLYTPVARDFKPKLKWHWSGSTNYAAYNQVMMLPVVGPLIDTNGDGKVDQLDIPCVVFTTFAGTGYQMAGVIRVLDGRDGREIMSIYDSLDGIAASAALALADLDGDGKPEIIAVTPNSKLIAFRNDGTKLWVSARVSSGDSRAYGGPSVADLDADGRPEVIFGKTVLNSDGTERWRGIEAGAAYVLSQPVIVDLFDTGSQNVLTWGSVYDASGHLLWTADTAGFMGVADFEGKGESSVAIVGGHYLQLYSRDGKLKWRTAIPGGGGGPLTIADADHDGYPDIAVAGAARISVFRADGSLLWSQVSQDHSSAITSSTFFDFDGDGSSDAVYADETQLRVFDGATGAIRWSIPNSSGTLLESPVVVDTDLDGHADLVVIANNYWIPGVNGVRVFQDENNAWVPTRSVWNQHAYSITNINDDLSVPRNPVPSWKSHNTFRLNKRMDADARAIADLTVGYLRVADGGVGGGSTLTVRVGNAGSYNVPAGTKLAVYNTDPALGQPVASARIGSASLSEALQSGQWQDVTITVVGDLAALSASKTVWIVGDDDGTGKSAITDFDRSNNILAGDLSAIALNLNLTVTTDKASYTEAEQAIFTAVVTNRGSFARETNVRFTVFDAAGQIVAVLPLGAPLTPGAGASAPTTAPWSVAGVLTGSYQVKAELVTPLGVVYAIATANFAVQASQTQANNARITTDRASYSAAQTVQLSARVANLTANASQDNLIARTTVRNALGVIVFDRSEPIAQLAPGAQRQYSYSLSASSLAAGSYSAQLQLLDSMGAVLGQSASSFTLVGSEQSGVGITGKLQATPGSAIIGQSVALNLSASNAGNAVLLNVPITVRVLNPETGAVVASFSQSVTRWEIGAQINLNWNWSVAGTPGQVLVAAATAQIAAREVALGQANIRLVGVEAPLLLEAQRKAEARILVLVSCPVGQGNNTVDDALCVGQRSQAIGAYLDSLGLLNKVVSTSDRFVSELRFGLYNTYWISGGALKLSAQTVQELREAVWRGDALIMDGVHDSRNQLLHPVAGVKQNGKLPQRDQIVNIPAGSVFTPGALPTLGQPTRFDLMGGHSQALFTQVPGNQGDVPAIVSHRHGAGSSMLFAFDLAAMLQANAIPGSAQLRDLIAVTASQGTTNPATLTAGEVVALSLRVTNPADTPREVRLQATLPVGISHSSASPAAEQSGATLSWRFTLAAHASQEITWRVKLELDQSAALVLPVQVYGVGGSSSATVPEASVDLTLTSVAGSALIAAANPAVSALLPASGADTIAKNKALNALAAATNLHNQAQYTQAIAKWLEAIELVAGITSVDASAAHSALAWALQASTVALGTSSAQSGRNQVNWIERGPGQQAGSGTASTVDQSIRGSGSSDPRPGSPGSAAGGMRGACMAQTSQPVVGPCAR